MIQRKSYQNTAGIYDMMVMEQLIINNYQKTAGIYDMMVMEQLIISF